MFYCHFTSFKHIFGIISRIRRDNRDMLASYRPMPGCISFNLFSLALLKAAAVAQGEL